MSQDPAGAFYGSQVGRMIVIDRSRHRYNMKFCFPKLTRIRCKFHSGLCNHFISHFISGVNATFIKLDLLFIEVKPDYLDLSGKGYGNGHSYIAKSHQ